MSVRAILVAAMVILPLAVGPAQAWKGETTVTGVISNVDVPNRRATVTPQDGAPVRVEFDWDVGGVCSICLGSGMKGATFDDTIKDGSVWTVVYTTSYPDGDIHTVNRVIKVGAADDGKREGN